LDLLSPSRPLVERLATRVSSRHLAWLYALAAVVVSLQKYRSEAYNNYRVFTGSLRVLLEHQPLYAPHPERYGDLFKYSPTFPFLMVPVVWLPDAVGLIGWNLLNALALYASLAALWPGERRAVLALALTFVELVVSMQHTQSNALVAALIIATFVALERERSWRAGFFVAAGFFLKGYGLAAGCLTLLYRRRGRSIGATAAWGIALALLPLVVLPAAELMQAYRDWLGVRGTFTVMRNMSIMRVVAQYVSPAVRPTAIQIAGLAIFLLPFARIPAWRDPRFRVRVLCSLLIAIVIFNNSAEPPTYVIAVAGAAIWYASEPRRSPADRWGTLALLLAITLISTDIYPRALRGILAGPWTFKATGCLVGWLRINWVLLRGTFRGDGGSGDRRGRREGREHRGTEQRRRTEDSTDQPRHLSRRRLSLPKNEPSALSSTVPTGQRRALASGH
jgi:hypothetical protein